MVLSSTGVEIKQRGTDVRLEGLERRAVLMGDKHGFGKFHAMLIVDSTYHVRSKGQTKWYGPAVNHLKRL